MGLGLAVAPILLLVWLYRALGAGLVLGVVLVAATATAGLRVRRTVVRRRGGHYSPAELARLDDQGLALATGRMLRRDGWRVVDLTARQGRPRLYARDLRGRELDVAFRPAATAAADNDEDTSGPAPLPEAGRPSINRLIRVVVHLGTFSRTAVLWGSRQGGVHLLDGRQLQRWASGAALDDLGLLGYARPVLDRGAIGEPTRLTHRGGDLRLVLDVQPVEGPASVRLDREHAPARASRAPVPQRGFPTTAQVTVSLFHPHSEMVR
ncbi:hypothetical protein [Streptomyces sp. NPDC058451]|uniref:hypothetical protein n=1 Tax=Streptomyces sp. NPDC058451 TaxID=3346506 RepID=UPI0036541D7A